MRAARALALALVVVLAACAAPPEPGPRERAAAEATALIERAEATAIMQRAQATVTALAGGGQPRPDARAAQPQDNSQRALATAAPATARPRRTAEQSPASGVELLSVGLAADGGMISVQFRASPAVARQWTQGNVYLVEESSGRIFNEIPVMPNLGPLLSRPRVAGQIGYVMLVNAAPRLAAGALVTVVLGDFRQEHVSLR